MGKGVKSKKSGSNGFAKEIIGMGILLFSILSLLCLITGDIIFYTVGSYVRGFFLGLFGYYAFVVIGLVILLGLRLLLDRSIIPAGAKRIAIIVCLLAFSIMSIVQTALFYDRAAGFSHNFSACYGGGLKNFGTTTVLGAISMLIINPLGKVSGKAGCYVLFSLLIVLLLALAFKGQIVGFFKSAHEKRPAKKKTDENREATASENTDALEPEEYHLPYYFASNANFKMKSKRDYAKEGRQIEVLGGNFGMKSQGGKNIPSGGSYGEQYRKDLSPEANYIMTPPPLRPESIGQPPIKADNPSESFDKERKTAPEYDRFALGGSVYTVPTERPVNREDLSKRGMDRSRDARSSRGGLFDGMESTSRMPDSDRSRFDRTQDTNRFDRTQNSDRFERPERPERSERKDFSRDIEERLGVDRGKQPTGDALSQTVGGLMREPIKEEPSMPNIEKTYNPAEHGVGGFGENLGFGDRFDRREPPKSNVPDLNGEDDFSRRTARTVESRGLRGSTDDGISDKSPADNFMPSGGRRLQDSTIKEEPAKEREPSRRESSMRAPQVPPVTSPTTPSVDQNHADSGSDFTSSTASQLSQFDDDLDPNEGYSSIEDMPLNYRYSRPSVELLNDIFVDQEKVFKERERLRDLALLVQENFAKRGVSVTLENIVYGMTITRFEYTIPITTSVKSFTQNQGDIAVWLHSKGDLRILAPIPGTSKIGIEVPNGVRADVGLKELLCSPQYRKIKQDGIYIPAGKNVMAEPVFLNLTDMPHLLIAGATGKGKSVFLNAMLVSLLYTYSPEDLRIVIVDPKQLEFVSFEGIPHLLFNKIITKAEEAAALLNYLVKEMEDRYALFAKARVKKIANYNEVIDKKTTKKLPYIIVLIDEFADLMMKNPAAKKDMDASIQRLAQLARAAGISLVFATQRPTTDVIDGTIKNNFPARICFKTADYTNSQVVIGENGAEKLLGKGDLLYKIDGPTERAQGAYVKDEEIDNVVSYITKNNKCYYDKKLFEYINKMAKTYGQTQSSDHEQMSMDLGESGNPQDMPIVYRRAVRAVITQNTTSKSMLQTKLGIGYNKAARIIDWMEKQGYISCVTDNKQREIRIDRAGYEQIFGEPFNEDITQ